jgi:hypothetical protein
MRIFCISGWLAVPINADKWSSTVPSPPPNDSAALLDPGLLIVEGSRSHSDKPHSDSSGRAIRPSQRRLTDNTHHTRETDIHSPCRIRTRNPCERMAADPRLRPCGHWIRYALLVSRYKQKFQLT